MSSFQCLKCSAGNLKAGSMESVFESVTKPDTAILAWPSYPCSKYHNLGRTHTRLGCLVPSLSLTANPPNIALRLRVLGPNTPTLLHALLYPFCSKSCILYSQIQLYSIVFHVFIYRFVCLLVSLYQWLTVGAAWAGQIWGYLLDSRISSVFNDLVMTFFAVLYIVKHVAFCSDI